MNELLFKRIVILFSIVGLLLLLTHSFFFTPKNQSISSLYQLKEGTVLSTRGVIKELSQEDNFTKFNICEYSVCVPAILFNPSNNQTNLLNDYSLNKKQIKLTGQYKTYMDNPEIIVYKIERYDSN